MTDHRTIYKATPPPPTMPRLPDSRERRRRAKARIAAMLALAGLFGCGSSDPAPGSVSFRAECGEGGQASLKFDGRDEDIAEHLRAFWTDDAQRQVVVREVPVSVQLGMASAPCSNGFVIFVREP